ncbi:MAG: DUF6046 domain-containing protein [Flammeovirgaceae bacterium]
MADVLFNLQSLAEQGLNADVQATVPILGGFKGTVFNQVVLGSFILPNEPNVSVSGTNTIKNETSLGTNDKDGQAVNEYIGNPTFTVTIDGILINETANAYPAIQVARLMNIFNRKKPVTIISPLLLTMGIKKVVINSINFDKVEGSLHTQPYTISCTTVKDSSFDIIETLTKPIDTLLQDNDISIRIGEGNAGDEGEGGTNASPDSLSEFEDFIIFN